MGKYISFGNYDYYFIYIIFYILFSLINTSLIEMNYYNALNGIEIIHNGKLKDYKLIHQIFSCYFGTFIYSLIFYKIEERKYNNTPQIIIERETQVINNLIYEDNKEQINKPISILSLILIIFCWVLEEQVLELYGFVFNHLDFWMFELIILSIINSKFFRTPIYKHHLFVLFFSLVPISFKIVTIIFSFGEEEEHQVIYVRRWRLLPIGLSVYLIVITIKAYAIIKLKWLMDLKYISANKLLIFYGIIGMIFYTIICIISIFVDIPDSFFIVSQNSLIEYLKQLKKSTKSELIYEIIGKFIGMILYYIIKYCFMMIIKYLTSVHVIFLTPTFYLFHKLVLFIYNIIYCSIVNDFGHFLKEDVMLFCLDISGDIISFIGYLIYLGIIQLNFCKLNYNVRNTIIKRGNLEFNHLAEGHLGSYQSDTFSEISDDDTDTNGSFSFIN